MQDFGDRIRAARYAFGLSQRQIAAIVEINFQNVSEWEKKTFEPKPNVKKRIADFLHLSINWLVSRTDFPFLANQITTLRPLHQHYPQSLLFIDEAIEKTRRVDVFCRPSQDSDGTYYILIFRLERANSVVFFYPPLGYERAFEHDIDTKRKVSFHGEISFPNSKAEDTFKASYQEVLSAYERLLSHKLKRIPTEYFFVDLYNTKREELINFIYATAKTWLEKIEKKDKLLFDKIVHKSLNIFDHHHDNFKRIVRKWAKRAPFSDKERTVLIEFVGSSPLKDLLMPFKKDRWEVFLTRGMQDNRIDPYSHAYAELEDLIIMESHGIEVERPKIDEKEDKLYWP